MSEDSILWTFDTETGDVVKVLNLKNEKDEKSNSKESLLTGDIMGIATPPWGNWMSIYGSQGIQIWRD